MLTRGNSNNACVEDRSRTRQVKGRGVLVDADQIRISTVAVTFDGEGPLMGRTFRQRLRTCLEETEVNRCRVLRRSGPDQNGG
jgi:hypothetical protein